MPNTTVNEKVATKQFNIANDHFNRKSYRLAQKRFLKSIELFPMYAEAWGKLALAYDASGETEKARNAFQQAFRIGPETQNLSLNMGNFELKHGNDKDALQIFRKGLESNPQDTELMNAYSTLKKILEIIK